MNLIAIIIPIVIFLLGFLFAKQEEVRFKKMERVSKAILGTEFDAIKKNEKKLTFTEKVEIELIRTDLPWKAKEFILINFVVVIIIFIFFSFVMKQAIVGFVLSLSWIFVPMIAFHFIKKRKMNKIEEQLIPSLNLLKDCLKAGYPFMQSMNEVAKEISHPLGDEFKKFSKDLAVGKDFEESISELDKRVGSDELTLLCTSVVINQKIGGKMTDVVDNIIRIIEARVKLKREINTLSAQGKFSSIIVSIIPFGLFALVYRANPDYMKPLLTEAWGWVVISTALGMIALAGFISYRIVNMKLL